MGEYWYFRPSVFEVGPSVVRFPSKDGDNLTGAAGGSIPSVDVVKFLSIILYYF